jgi:DNA-binding transcriptional regulator PaaX
LSHGALQRVQQVAAVEHAGALVDHGLAVQPVVQRRVQVALAVELQHHAAQAHQVTVVQGHWRGHWHVVVVAAVGRTQVAQQHLRTVDQHLGMAAADAGVVQLHLAFGRTAQQVAAFAQRQRAAGLGAAVDHQAAGPVVVGVVQRAQPGQLAPVH